MCECACVRLCVCVFIARMYMYAGFISENITGWGRGNKTQHRETLSLGGGGGGGGDRIVCGRAALGGLVLKSLGLYVATHWHGLMA